ncbi:MAG: hypothetical protein AB1540_09065 [Bdellovibrionota bacterium]
MTNLPSSPSRDQAAIEFEPVLHQLFEALTRKVNSEARDAMHYVLFSTRDRFCISALWLVAPRLGISVQRISRVACAIEAIGCSLAIKTRNHQNHTRRHERFIEPALLEAATYGLVPLAFEMVLNSNEALTLEERHSIAEILSRAASPIHVLSALHRESQVLREGNRLALTRPELLELQQEKVTPVYQASGEILGLLAKDPIDRSGLADWFKKLGLFSHWVDELISLPSSSQSLSVIYSVAPSEAVDLIKSLEAELLEKAKALGLVGAAHEIIEPLADALKNRLQ